MKRVFLILLALLFLQAAPVYAQAPEPDTGYNFEPKNFDAGAENPVATTLAAQMTDVSFINELGSNFATMMAIMDNFAGGGVLGYFTIFMVGLWVLHWLATYVFKRRLSRYDAAADAVDDRGGRQAEGDLGRSWSKMGRELSRRKRSF